MASDSASTHLAADLGKFTAEHLSEGGEYSSFIAVFRSSAGTSEEAFEEQLWQQLSLLNRIDPSSWDPRVASDPNAANFSFSFGGCALYVIGLHPHSSRMARRFRWPALVFNPHAQFERLRSDGKWKKMQESIRTRDVRLQGNVNPMLSDFGESSEARQYSGRAVDDKWEAPFRAVNPTPPAGCPFSH